MGKIRRPEEENPVDALHSTSRADEGLFEQIYHGMMAIPSEYYFLASVASIIASAALYASGRRHSALFVGEWAPTLLISALFYKMLHPAHDNVGERIREAVSGADR
jgi:hypothetical protein